MKETGRPVFLDDVYPGLQGRCPHCWHTYTTVKGDKGLKDRESQFPQDTRDIVYGQTYPSRPIFLVICPNCQRVFAIDDPKRDRREIDAEMEQMVAKIDPETAQKLHDLCKEKVGAP